MEENTIIRTYIYSIMKQLLNEQVLSKTDCYGIAQTLLWGRKQQDYLLVQELLDILSDYFTVWVVILFDSSRMPRRLLISLSNSMTSLTLASPRRPIRMVI